MGDARDIDLISQGIDLSEQSILRALVTDLKRLFELGVNNLITWNSEPVTSQNAIYAWM